VARIRIIDEWLRSPVSSPSRHRAVMVVADSWSEQRVLMRAFAACSDQTRPTIVLHGVELAIGPAGSDPHGTWGIHIEPPVDGRAQELRQHLELAARRLAGSKGNPPRLVDEVSRFDNKATHMWAPGTPPDLPGAVPPLGASPSTSGSGATRLGFAGGQSYYEPAEVAPPIDSPVIPSAAASMPLRAAPQPSRPPIEPAEIPTLVPVGSRTEPGFVPTPVRARTPSRPAPPTTVPPATAAAFATLVGRTMPIGLQLGDQERELLNALGRVPHMSAGEIGRLVAAPDPVAWMEQLLTRLTGIGLDLIVRGEPTPAGEPTYSLRR
jgi:hypothetical protein